MSALGTRPDAVSDYHKTKYKAEEYVRASGLDWTIFRPSMIHGPGGEFMQMEATWARGQGDAVPVHALLRRRRCSAPAARGSSSRST